MKVSYSLKHADTKFESPLLGTEITDGMYADICPHGIMFTVLVIGEDTYWFSSSHAFSLSMKKSIYKTEGDRRFASFPKHSVIPFTQDKLT